MKNIAIVALAAALSFVSLACGTTGIPQADHDAVVQELNASRIEAAKAKQALETCQNAPSSEVMALRKERALLRSQLRADLKELIDAGTLDVVERNGMLVVKMNNNILFKSGSVSLAPDGLKALESAAAVLAKLDSRRFLVVGHTDDTPIKKKKMRKFSSNMQLSTARAGVVVAALTQSGMSNKQLIVGGFSSNDPIGDNATDDGKAMNRRIELIVLPDMSKLLGVVEKTEG